jgi:dihydrofolate synthase/folylpolyglutamate synthase
VRFSKLQDWLDWQTQLHLKSIDLGLERVSAVWKKMHSGKLDAFVITVAGTNGKGSSVAMLEAILLSAGYSVGCYMSPHLVRYNERIRINAQEATDDQICHAFAAIDEARQDISLSYFEFGTLAALSIFSQLKPDVIILEVGLGGRLDAVNIIDADAALISSIDLDHQDWLGDNREAIGREKAGIFRANQQSVFAGDKIPDSVFQQARQSATALHIAGKDYHYRQHADGWSFNSDMGNRHALPIPALRGHHQLDNAAGVVALLMACKTNLSVSSEAIRQGLLSAQLKGRFQVLQKTLPVIIDVAHNEQSMLALRENLQAFIKKGRLHAIFGMLKDKDIENSIKPLLSEVDSWYLVSTPGERGLNCALLNDVVQQLSPDTQTCLFEKVGDAYEYVLQYAQQQDTILIAGSFLIAGEFLQAHG